MISLKYMISILKNKDMFMKILEMRKPSKILGLTRIISTRTDRVLILP